MARRKRCVLCKELSLSDWVLEYTNPKKKTEVIKGNHCFKCSRKVRDEHEQGKIPIKVSFT